MTKDNPYENAGAGTPKGAAPLRPPASGAKPAKPAPVPPSGASRQLAASSAAAVGAGAAATTSSAAASAAAPAPKKPSKAPLIVIIVLLCLIFLGVVVSCAVGQGANGVTGSDKNIAVITLNGSIDYDGTECSPEGLKMLLNQAEEDSSIKAVVLRVNSGGGVTTAGEEMSEYVKAFSKPIVVSSAAINASAAYMISSQSNWIFVARTTDIGSIGVIRTFTSYGELYDLLGIDVEVIKSASSKDSTYGIRPLTEEERQHYQKVIDETNEVFINFVVEGRGMSTDKVRELANGLAWTGTTAVSLGLADEVGTLDDACAKAAELAGCSENYQVTELQIAKANIGSLLGLLLSSESSSMSSEELAQLLKELKVDGSNNK